MGDTVIHVVCTVGNTVIHDTVIHIVCIVGYSYTSSMYCWGYSYTCSMYCGDRVIYVVCIAGIQLYM